MSLTSLRLGFIGTGVMGEAILAGLSRADSAATKDIVCSHPRADRRRLLEEQFHILTTADNYEAARDADIVILCVKPQVLGDVISELSGRLSERQLVVSIVAGASTGALQKRLQHTAIVRAMPNTPAQIGEGVTVWYVTHSVNDAQRDAARTLLASLGKQWEVTDENHVAMATAVSGTGPTYIFLFIEALVDSAVHLGFPRHMARELVLETLRGSTSFAMSSGKHVAELRDMVTSPGGTSAAALYELEKGRLRTVVNDAVHAAFTRTLQLQETTDLAAEGK